MAKIPEFTHQTAIQPQAQAIKVPDSPNLLEPIAGLMKEAYGEILNQELPKLAQQAVKEGALKPTAITKADFAYNQFFNQAEQTLKTREAANSLSQISMAAQINPSAENIASLNKNAQNLIKNTVAGVSADSKFTVEENLNKALFAINSSIQQQQVKLGKANLQKVQSDVVSAQLDILKTAAQVEDAKGISQSLQAFNNVIDKYATQLGLQPSQIIAFKHAGEMAARKGVAEKEITNLYNTDKEKAAEYLAALNKKLPKTADDLEIEQIAFQTYNRLVNYDQALNNVNYSNLEVMRTQGQLTQEVLETKRSSISLNQYLKLQQELVADNIKALGNMREINFLQNNKDNPGALALQTQDNRNKSFNAIVARDAAVVEELRQLDPNIPPFNLGNIVDIANSIKAPLTDFTKQLSYQVQAADVDQAMQAAQAIRSLFNNNPIAIQGIDNKALSVALNATENVRLNDLDNQVAIQRARQRVYGEDAEQNKLRMDDFNSTINSVSRGRTTESFLAAAFQQQLNLANGSQVSPDVLLQFQKSMQDHYVYNGASFANAMQMAATEIGSAYGASNINGGKPTNMVAPPEKYVAYGEMPWVRNNFLLETRKFFNASKAAYDKKESEFYYEIYQPQLFDNASHLRQTDAWIKEHIDIFSTPLLDDALQVTKVYRNGEKIYGVLQYDSDRFTQTDPSGAVSYVGKFKADNFIEPMVIPNGDYQPHRVYIPVLNEALKHMQAKQRQQVQESIQRLTLDKEIENQIRQLGTAYRMESYGAN